MAYIVHNSTGATNHGRTLEVTGNVIALPNQSDILYHFQVESGVVASSGSLTSWASCVGSRVLVPSDVSAVVDGATLINGYPTIKSAYNSGVNKYTQIKCAGGHSQTLKRFSYAVVAKAGAANAEHILWTPLHAYSFMAGNFTLASLALNTQTNKIVILYAWSQYDGGTVTTGRISVTPPIGVNINDFHAYVVSVNYTSNNVTLYVDGVEAYNDTMLWKAASWITDNTNFNISFSRLWETYALGGTANLASAIGWQDTVVFDASVFSAISAYLMTKYGLV